MMETVNPYKKIYHLAKLISQDGDVSPLCAKNPKKIKLERELWTTDLKAVTCKECLKILRKEQNND